MLVMRLAMHDSMLMNAILALAARYDGSTGEMSAKKDGEAALYHFRCLTQLIPALRESSHAIETLFATVVTAQLYEELGPCVGNARMHLDGSSRILDQAADEGVLVDGGLIAAAGWVHLRQAIGTALLNQKFLDVRLSNFKDIVSSKAVDDSAYTNRIVYHFARALQLFYSVPNTDNAQYFDLQSDSQRKSINEDCDTWFRNRPSSFNPLFYEAPNHNKKQPFSRILLSRAPHGNYSTQLWSC